MRRVMVCARQRLCVTAWSRMYSTTLASATPPSLLLLSSAAAALRLSPTRFATAQVRTHSLAALAHTQRCYATTTTWRLHSVVPPPPPPLQQQQASTTTARVDTTSATHDAAAATGKQQQHERDDGNVPVKTRDDDGGVAMHTAATLTPEEAQEVQRGIAEAHWPALEQPSPRENDTRTSDDKAASSDTNDADADDDKVTQARVRRNMATTRKHSEASGSGDTSSTRGPDTDDVSNIPIGRVVRKVWSYLWPAKEYKIRCLVAGSVLCVLLAKCLKVVVPFWFKAIVDALAPTTAATAAAASSAATAAGGPLAVGVFGCVVGYGLCRLVASVTEELKTILFAPVGGHASTQLAMEMFDKLHHLDLHWHLSRETGTLSKDLDRGSRAFWTLAYTLLFLVVPTAFEMTLVCVALHTQAGLQFIAIASTAVAAYIAWTLAVTNWRARFRARYNALDSRLGGLIVDSLLNYETVKYFCSERYESARIRAETTQMNKQLIRLDQSMAVLNVGQQLIFVVAGVLSLYLATCAVLAAGMSVGDLVLIDALLLQLYLPLSYLGMIYREVQTSTQNMQAMIALLDQQTCVCDVADARPYTYVNGTIELRDVCFSYQKKAAAAATAADAAADAATRTMTTRTVLNRLSLTIPGGSTVAFVGPSGSGKSTIFRLLYRFYDPSAGSILLDGQPLSQLQLRSVRQCIGVIPQDTVLFNESVRYNIRYGRMDATDADVEDAARKASLHETVARMHDGYDTSVGERGLKLSGGEKQRVAIARVLLDDPPILLADEATSALDSTTELNVMRTLKEATRRTGAPPRTIILIAHRLTTVREADIIFVLDGQGGLAESGTHFELLCRGGLYADMWYQQLRERRREEAAGAQQQQQQHQSNSSSSSTASNSKDMSSSGSTSSETHTSSTS